MVSKAEILAQIEALKAQLDDECEGCGAPLLKNFKGDYRRCEYCGRSKYEDLPEPEFFKPLDVMPEEPPDIRKTNASDDPCPMCQQVHPKDTNTPLTCRCLYCGQIGQIAMSTYDPILGFGIVCRTCIRGAGPPPAPSEAMPWESGA